MEDMRMSVVVAAAVKVHTMAAAKFAASARMTADQDRTTAKTNTATARTADMSVYLRAAAAAVVRAWGERLFAWFSSVGVCASHCFAFFILVAVAAFRLMFLVVCLCRYLVFFFLLLV